MASIKVSIVNPTTLKLEERGEVGDLILLKDLQNVDNTAILDAIKAAKDETYKEQLSIITKQMNAEKAIAVNDAEKRLNAEFEKIKRERDELELKNKSFQEKLDLEKKNIEATLKANFLVEKATLENKKNTELSQKESEYKDKLLEKESEVNKLKISLEQVNNQKTNSEQSLKNDYERQLQLKQEQVDYYKDFKAKASTKMIGESLELYCEDSFNKIRSVAFVGDYFEKDNDVKTGSKGDFIYRSMDEYGNELTSIMFEMKNEMETTATKHKNEDFLKELNKDREEKHCEYAVLVSLLEIDSELYNQGIVDVSHRYPKMYVIRPQFFIPIITLIKNASLKVSEYKRELNEVKQQNIDVSNFEDNLKEFQTKFGNHYRIASEKFKKAIEEIDKTIEHLNKIKDSLFDSERHLRLANEKAEDLSIKKLTKNSPTMQKEFLELNKNRKDN